MTEFVGTELDMNNVKITNLATPTSGQDATNKTYVDSVAGGTYVAGAGLTDSPANTFNVANTDANLTISANSVDFSVGAAAVVAAGPAAALASVAPPVVNTSGASTLGVGTTAARADHTHGIALATTSVQGAMSAVDKATLTNYFGNGFYNVVDHGVSTANSGATNLTAMNALLTAATANSTIYFPPSTTSYQFSNVVTIPAKAFRFLGGGQTKSIIQTNHATANVFSVGALGTDFVGLRFGTTVTRTGGAAILVGNFSNVNVYNCYFDSQFNGIEYNGGAICGVDCFIDDCYFFETVTYGISIRGIDSTLRVTNSSGTCTSGVTDAYVQLYECASFTMDDCRWKNAVSNFRIDPNSGTLSVRNVAVSNSLFESSTAASVKTFGAAAGVTIKGMKFQNCGFNTSGSGFEITGNSATVKLTGARFANCDFLGNTGQGLHAVVVQDISLSNCLISGNGGNGFKIAAATGSVTKFEISNCTIGPGAGLGGNNLGIEIEAGAYASYTVSNNIITGNAANLSDLGTVATTDLKKVINNAGNLIQGTIASNRGGVTSGTAETLLFNARVPPRSVLAGQVLRFTVWGQTSDVGTLIFRVRAGAAGTVAGDTTVISLQATTAVQAANAWQCFSGLVRVVTTGGSGTVGAEGEVLASGLVTSQAAAAETLATVNTDNAWFIDLTCACAVAGTFTVRNGVVEVV